MLHKFSTRKICLSLGDKEKSEQGQANTEGKGATTFLLQKALYNRRLLR